MPGRLTSRTYPDRERKVQRSRGGEGGGGGGGRLPWYEGRGENPGGGWYDGRRSAGAVRLQRLGQPKAVRRRRGASAGALLPGLAEQPRRDPRDAGPHRVGRAAVAVPLAGQA